MGNGQNVSEFTMTMASVGPATMSSEFDIVNDMGQANYLTSRWMTGKDIDRDTLRGGVNLTDTVLLSADGNAEWVGANADINVQQEQTGSTWSTPWAIALAYMTWNEPTVDAVVGNAGPGGRKIVYKDLMYQLQQVAYQTTLDLIEGAVVRDLPHFAITEATDPEENRKPYGIHACLNEYDNPAGASMYASAPPAGSKVKGLGGAGLIPATIDAGGDNWPAFQTLNPTTAKNVNWRPYQGTYGSFFPNYDGGTDEAAAAQTFWRSMALAMRHSSIEQPVSGAKYTDMYSSPRVTYCSFEGEAYAESMALIHNDRFRGVHNFREPDYHGMVFRGVPFQGIDSFGDVELYVNTADTTTATTKHTELDTSAVHTGPRFVGFDGTYANVAFQKSNIFDLSEPVYMGAAGKPFNWTQYCKIYMQLYFRSRRRHFHLRPDLAQNTTA